MVCTRSSRSLPLQILIIQADVARARLICQGLAVDDGNVITVVPHQAGLVQRVMDHDPDAIIVDLARPQPGQLEQMFQIARTVNLPTVIFVDDADQAMIEAAVDAGISAFIVDGLEKRRMKAVLDLAISRFRVLDGLQREMETLRSQLDERKIVDRAKSLLIKAQGISEPEAYALLRRAAMNQNRRIADVASSIVSAASAFSK